MNKDGKKTGGRKLGIPNKITRTMRELAKPHCKKALKKLVELSQSDIPAIALAASNSLLDRGYGKPVSIIEKTVEKTIDVQMDDTELARRVAFMLAMADEKRKEAELPAIEVKKIESDEIH